MQIEQHAELRSPLHSPRDTLTLRGPAGRPPEKEITPPEEEAPRDAVGLRPMSELPANAWRVVLGTWIAFFAVMALAFGGSTEVVFVLAVVATFGAVFFGVPMVLLRINKRTDPTQSKAYLDTLNGPLPKSEALAQIVMVPALLTLGLIVIGYLATHPQ